jgi:hypothetical protein
MSFPCWAWPYQQQGCHVLQKIQWAAEAMIARNGNLRRRDRERKGHVTGNVGCMACILTGSRCPSADTGSTIASSVGICRGARSWSYISAVCSECDAPNPLAIQVLLPHTNTRNCHLAPPPRHFITPPAEKQQRQRPARAKTGLLAFACLSQQWAGQAGSMLATIHSLVPPGRLALAKPLPLPPKAPAVVQPTAALRLLCCPTSLPGPALVLVVCPDGLTWLA